jgi:hypothetical protein
VDEVPQRGRCGMRTRNGSFIAVCAIAEFAADTALAMENIQDRLDGGVCERPLRRQMFDNHLNGGWTVIPKNVHQHQFGFSEAARFCLVGHAAH